MKKTLTRVLAIILVTYMIIASAPLDGFVGLHIPNLKAKAIDKKTSDELVLNTGNKITREQWIHNLAKTFDMSVEDEAYPDNYFSDLESTDEYYYDVLLAVNFGVIDVEAGGEIKPKELLDRSFASHTLNYCLGFQPKNESYTFSDFADCEYPADAQIAVDRSWFALVKGKFSPRNFVTDSEVVKMINDAQAVLESRVVNENYESSYKFASSVIEIPDGTDVSVEDDTVKITSCPKTIKSSSRFAAYQGGIPKIYEAVSVSKSGKVTTVKVNPDFDGSSLFLSVDAQGVADASEFDIVPEKDTTMTVDEISEPSSSMRKAKAAINLKKIYNFDKNISFGDGLSVSCKITMENPKVEYSFSTSPAKAHVVFTGNTTVSFDGTFDLTKATNLGSIPIGEIGVPGIGGLKFCVDLSLAGSVGISTSGNLRFGFNYSSVAGFSIERNFVSRSYCLTAAANATAGISANFGIDTMFVKAGVFFKVGGTATINSTVFTDGKKPMECDNFSAFLYCSFGLDASVTILGLKKGHNVTVNVWDAKTSPVKVARHYEDGKEVASCARGGKIGYFTPWNSIYGSSGWSKGFGSMGYDRDGKPVAVFEYELNSVGRAIITKYNGNATSLFIPSTIDGYPIEKLGDTVFRDNTRLKNVKIPDSITEIGKYCFESCSNIKSVNIPRNVEMLGCGAFANCTSIVSINIPKSLNKWENCYNFHSEHGPFYGCTNLSKINFEEGINSIPEHVFSNCKGIKELTIPDTVKTIGDECFLNCTELTQLNFSNSLTSIGQYSFKGCTGLTNLNFPDTLIEIGVSAFENCENVTDIKWSKGLTSIGNAAFYNTGISEVKMYDNVKSIGGGAFMECKNLSDVHLSTSLETIGAFALGYCNKLTDIKIPKSIKKTTEEYFPSHMYGYQFGVFIGSNNLKNVTFEEGITLIPNGLFSKSFSLEKIVIPDTVTKIGAFAFQYCSKLKEITLSKSLITIENDAFRSIPISKVDIPDSVKKIGSRAFMDCKSLSSVKLSKSVEIIDEYAFGSCDSLKAITIPKTVKSSSYGAFVGSNNLKTITFEKGTTTIANNLFRQVGGLEKIVIPDTVTSINYAAFQGCKNLKEVTLSKNLETIGEYAFDGCSSLNSITIPNTVTSIGEAAFRNCSSLDSVKLPNQINNLQYCVFENCTSLKSITIPESVTEIGSRVFRNCDSIQKIDVPVAVTKIGDWAFAESENLKTVNLKSNLIYIGYSAFRDCDSLEKIKIPNSVTEIGGNCFYDCDKLNSVELSINIKEIPNSIFENCDSLENVVIPQLVERIRDNAFKDCVKLAKITIPKSTTSISAEAFSYSDRLTIFGTSGTTAESFAKNNGYKFTAINVPAKSVTMTNKITVNNYDTVRIIPEITPIDFTDNIVWKTSNPNIVSVDETGAIRGESVGTATIKLCVGNVTASCTVTVVQPVRNIYMNTELELEAGETKSLEVSIYPSNANNKEVSYSSSDSSIASVDGSGNVTAHKKGTAVITVSAKDGSGVKNTCNVTVVNNCYTVTDTKGFESPHNYPISSKDIWVYSKKGASSISLTFDKRTSIEDGFDYIKIYDANNNEVGSYTGNELSGKTITVESNTVKVKLISDDAGTDWGFKVVKISFKSCQKHNFEDKIIAPTCTRKGYTLHTCTLCGFAKKDSVKAALGHSYTTSSVTPATLSKDGKIEGKCTSCGKKSTTAIAKIADVTLSEASFAYNGKAQKPTVTVKDANGKTVSSKNYTLSYSKGCTAVGTYSVKVTFKGNYSGSKTLSFTIVSSAIAQVKSLKASSKTSAGVTLTWAKVSGATGYEVYKYSSSSKKYIKIGSTTSNTFKANELLSSTKYMFAVKAYRANGGKKVYGKASSLLTVTTSKQGKPAQVAKPKATKITATTITLSWAKVGGADIKYYVYRYNAKTKKYTNLGSTTSNKFTVKKLKAGTKYSFAVKAYGTKSKKYGNVSPLVSTATAPNAPTGVKVTAGKKQAAVKWSKVTGATNYTVYYSTSKNGKYKSAGTTTKTSLTVKPLSSGKTYYFKVMANEKLGNTTIKSAYSAVKSAKAK